MPTTSQFGRSNEMMDTGGMLDLQAWARRYEAWLRTCALPLWWTVGADFAVGGFHEALNVDARPLDRPRRMRGQARQTYVVGVAARLGWAGPWTQATEHGLDYLLGSYRRPDGLFATLVSPQGTVLDSSTALYDQAFMLLASSAAHRALPHRSDAREVAYRLVAALEALRHPSRGFVEIGDRPYQANAHMHLLEASLAWLEVDEDGPWRDLANEVIDLALDKFIAADLGVLLEYFDDSWEPLAGDEGRIIEPGHQYEWAWLLMQGVRLLDRPELLVVADDLMRAGARGSLNGADFIVDELWSDLTIRSADCRFWPHTECIRAVLTRIDFPGADRAALEADAVSAARALWSFLETPIAGLWWDRRLASGRFVEEPSRNTSLYHLLGAILKFEAYRQG